MIKIAIWGLIFAIVHMVLTISLSVYFGLGMSSDATWFMKNIVMQPAAFIIKFVEKNSEFQIHRYLLFINFIFYWAASTLLFFLFKNIKEL